MARDDNGAARVAHPRGFVKVPAFHQAINEAGGEGIAGAEDIVNGDGKSRHVARRLIPLEQSRALLAAFHHDGLQPANLHGLDGGGQIAGHLRSGNLRVRHVHLVRVGKGHGFALVVCAQDDIYKWQRSSNCNAERARVVPLVRAKIQVQHDSRARRLGLFGGEKIRAAARLAA